MEGPVLISLLSLLCLSDLLRLVPACPSGCNCVSFRGQPPETALQVNCQGAGFSTIPQGLPHQTRGLNLASNQITQIVKSDFQNKNLLEINLSGNQISEIPTEAFNIKGDCDIQIREHVRFARWEILNVVTEQWPCAIDLRGNPISRVSSRAFAGSANVSVLLGMSKTDLRIETLAFADMNHVLGIIISDMPTLTLPLASLDGINNIGWLVIDQTEVAFRDQVFSAATTTRPHWFRVSNCNVLHLMPDVWALTMPVNTKCDVKTYEYGPAKVLSSHISTLTTGGIELINNQLPVLPTKLFHRGHIGGILLTGNTISEFEEGAFTFEQIGEDGASMCTLFLIDNNIKTIHTNMFSGLKVHHLTVSEATLTDIQGGAFANTRINRLRVAMSSNTKNNALTQVRSRAFRGISELKIFDVRGIEGARDNVRPLLQLEPFTFAGMPPVDYMSMYLYENMRQLAANVFTGLQVRQNLALVMSNVDKIDYAVFGDITDTATSIARLDIDGVNHIECNCVADWLNDAIQTKITTLLNLACTDEEKGSIPLQQINVTCPPPPTLVSGAPCLSVRVLLVLVAILVYLIE